MSRGQIGLVGHGEQNVTHKAEKLKLKLKLNKALDENSSFSYRAPPAIWDQCYLQAATRHKLMCSALTPGSKLILNLPISERWKAELT